MGRAIVRKPKAFLFDEPLSNLDARLREQMRSEIKKLHFMIGATSVYVTHDQIEAMTMADRIVAMNDGVVQQVGSPLEIYDRPTNIFVASFIGSPAMNFISGRFARSGSAARLHFADVHLPVPEMTGVSEGADVLAGVRPEHFDLVMHAGSGLAGQVELIEPMGLSTLVHVSLAGNALKVLSFKRLPLRPGMPVGISVAPERVHLFDPKSEQRLH
jgi:multiple sugar transport system ATP-binding protein